MLDARSFAEVERATFTRSPLPGGGERLLAAVGSEAVSFRAALLGWRDDPIFQRATLDTLATTCQSGVSWHYTR